jgi:hypothetical protein
MRWAGDAGQVCYVLVRRPPISGPSNRGVFSFRISRFVLGGSHGDPNFGAIHTFLLGRGRKTADRGAKILERVFLKFGLLQVLEIAQNRQIFLWKSWTKQADIWKCLEKKLGGFVTHPGDVPCAKECGRARRARAAARQGLPQSARREGRGRPHLGLEATDVAGGLCSSPAPRACVDAPARPR